MVSAGALGAGLATGVVLGVTGAGCVFLVLDVSFFCTVEVWGFSTTRRRGSVRAGAAVRRGAASCTAGGAEGVGEATGAAPPPKLSNA
ncbi:hypothetical protein AZ09_09035 [Acetobacter aceti 1023]|nr:hypothetical protein AZ09_09035 [Acetobacter aceti 1023]